MDINKTKERGLFSTKTKRQNIFIQKIQKEYLFQIMSFCLKLNMFLFSLMHKKNCFYV